MTLFLSVILLRLVLEDDYLLALAIFYYCSCYSSSYVRSTYFDILTFAENEYLRTFNEFLLYPVSPLWVAFRIDCTSKPSLRGSTQLSYH